MNLRVYLHHILLLHLNRLLIRKQLLLLPLNHKVHLLHFQLPHLSRRPHQKQLQFRCLQQRLLANRRHLLALLLNRQLIRKHQVHLHRHLPLEVCPQLPLNRRVRPLPFQLPHLSRRPHPKQLQLRYLRQQPLASRQLIRKRRVHLHHPLPLGACPRLPLKLQVSLAVTQARQRYRLPSVLPAVKRRLLLPLARRLPLQQVHQACLLQPLLVSLLHQVCHRRRLLLPQPLLQHPVCLEQERLRHLHLTLAVGAQLFLLRQPIRRLLPIAQRLLRRQRKRLLTPQPPPYLPPRQLLRIPELPMDAPFLCSTMVDVAKC